MLKRLILVMVPLVLSALRTTTQMNLQEVAEMGQVVNGVLVQMEEMDQASEEMGQTSPITR